MESYSKSLDTVLSCDVAVIGGGSAGATAAIAAASSGARTALIERYGFLGGTSTMVLDTFYGFYTPGARKIKVVGGVPDRILERLRECGAYLERPNTYGAGTGITYHPEYLKLVWEDLAGRAGVHVLLHTWLQDVESRNGRITGLIVATKAGLARIAARVVVDASGDADVCHFSGLPLENAGENEPAQMLTTTFRMCNVEVSRRKQITKAQFHEFMAEAAESGKYALARREGSDHVTTVANLMATNMTRVQSAVRRNGRFRNAADPEFLTQAEMEGRRQATEYIRFLRDCVPGYEHAELSSFGVQIGIRETRRIYGQYRLTREDVLEARRFDDQIGLCGAPIEDHHGGTDTRWEYLPEGECVGIPYRTLLPRECENLLVAGRCFSATHDAHASVRSMAQCMAMGQAAGTAAALAVNIHASPQELSIRTLQDELRQSGAILELAGATA
jgi:hypothetical protein